MFESIEIRKVTNGFIVILNTEDETTEYVEAKVTTAT